MPTGFTADIKDGISFKTFAMNCARAFGACMTLRDEAGGGEMIPDTIEPSTWHGNQAANDRTALADLEVMTPAQLDRAALDDFDKAETYRVGRLQEDDAQQAAYAAMLAKVNAWTPPTPDHERMKEFMAEQITSSMRFDSSREYLSKPTERKPGTQWFAERRQILAASIARHDHEQAEENRRAAERTQWLRALRTSLEA